MTSDLEQIAEEMERHPTAQHAMNGYAARICAWIAANKESPQRKAFVEAAEQYAKQVHDSKDHNLAMPWQVMQDAYRAMIKAEKVEAERGERTR